MPIYEKAHDEKCSKDSPADCCANCWKLYHSPARSAPDDGGPPINANERELQLCAIEERLGVTRVELANLLDDTLMRMCQLAIDDHFAEVNKQGFSNF